MFRKLLIALFMAVSLPVAGFGQITTLTGTGEAGFADGPIAQAKFNRPLDVTISRDGNLLLSEENNHRIRVITP